MFLSHLSFISVLWDWVTCPVQQWLHLFLGVFSALHVSVEAIPDALPHLTNFNFDLVKSKRVCHTQSTSYDSPGSIVPDFRDIQVLLHPEWILRDTLTPLLPSHVTCSPAHTITPTPTFTAVTSTRDMDLLLYSYPMHSQGHRLENHTGKSPRKSWEGAGEVRTDWPNQDRAQPNKLTSQLFICSSLFKSLTCLFYHSCISQST